MPFSEVARGAVSYQGLYTRLNEIRLPVEDHRAIRLEFAVHRPVTPANDLAVSVAGLLLTGQPVSILDAESVAFTERLRFLDEVASLLPYGMRSTLTANTSAERNFGFRTQLFFSAHSGIAFVDEVVWGQPYTKPIRDVTRRGIPGLAA